MSDLKALIDMVVLGVKSIFLIIVRAFCGPSVKKFATKIFLHRWVVHSLNNHQKKFSFSKRLA